MLLPSGGMLSKMILAPLPGCVVLANTPTPGVAQNAPPGAYLQSALRAEHAEGVQVH